MNEFVPLQEDHSRQILIQHFTMLDPENQPLGIFAADKKGFFVAINDEACILFRHTREELLAPMNIESFYRQGAEERSRLLGLVKCGLQKSFVLDLNIKGEPVYLRDNCRVIYDTKGEDIGILGFISDITDRETAARLMEQVPTGAYIADGQEQLRYVNEGLSKMLEFASPKELLNERRSLQENYFKVEDLTNFRAMFQSAVLRNASEVSASILLKKKDGSPIPVLARARPVFPVGKELPWREGIIVDLTPVQEYEKAFQKLPGFYELAKNAGGQFVIKRCSVYFAKLFGYNTPEEMRGISTRSLALDKKKYDSFAKGVADNPEPVVCDSLHVHDKKNHNFYISINAIALRDDQQQIVGRMGFVFDITAREEYRADLIKFRQTTGRLLHTLSNSLVRLRTGMSGARALTPYELKHLDPEELPSRIESSVETLVSELDSYLERAVPEEPASLDREELRRFRNLLKNRANVIPEQHLRPAHYRVFAEKILQAARTLSARPTENLPTQSLSIACGTVITLGHTLNLTELLELCVLMDNQIRLYRRRLASPPEDQIAKAIKPAKLVEASTREWNDFAVAGEILLKTRGIPAREVICREYDVILALGNLLHNAIKYSWTGRYARGEEKPAGFRFIELDGSESARKEFILKIRNFGVAITEDEIKTDAIFQPGYRGEYAGLRGRLGTGLGLLHARDIIEENGGKVTIESTPALPGADRFDYTKPFITTVTVRLPFAEEDK